MSVDSERAQRPPFRDRSNPDLLSISETARKLAVASRIVFLMAEAGLLKVVSTDRMQFVPSESVAKLIGLVSAQEIVDLFRKKAQRLSANGQQSNTQVSSPKEHDHEQQQSARA